MTLYAEVVLPLPLDQTFSYTVPELWQDRAQVGVRVLVPLGKRVLTGIIVNLRKRRPQRKFELKEIKEILDENPVFSPLFLSFTRKLSNYFYTSWGEILETSLPPSYFLKSKALVSLSEKGRETLETKDISNEERAILNLLQKRAYTPSFIQRKMRERNITYKLSRLVKKGLIKVQRDFKRPKQRREKFISSTQRQLEIDFSLDESVRQIAYEIIQREENSTFSPFLLFAPKNKREPVYFYLIRQILARERQVLFLVPEISLTKRFVEKFEKKLGEKVAVLHSQMSERNRELEWQKIKNGEADVVIGPRSALFCPFDNLGLIIVEEEHDDSYYQQERPSYDARKGAWLRAREEKTILVYGSAMPSVETYFQAKRGKYLLSMEDEGKKYKVLISEERKKRGAIGSQLLEKIEEHVRVGEKALIFINRRGYAPLLFCSRCEYIPKCVNCDIHLTYHKKEDKLVCHFCNYSISKVEVCPECGSKIIRMAGIGIEAVEDELRSHFPRKRISSVASDETRTRKELERIIQSFSNGKIDILVGTQLLAHQVDLPSASLVGIIYPETGLAFSDFRASQKTFNTIVQMMSHAGVDRQGEAVIQTALPTHFSIQTAASQDYISFYTQEIRLRQNMNCPPFSNVVGVLFQGKNLRVLAQKSREFSSQVKRRAEDIEVLGPALAGVPRLRGLHRVQMILKARRRKYLDGVLKEALQQVKLRGSISVYS
ncbi:MAG: primosomal protein N' [Candidatus Aminicenantaceae bacterium]